MKCNKSQKGITLIALIVTIVILVILAGVAVSQIDNSDSGILGKADSMHEKTEEYIDDMQSQKDAYLDYLKNELARRISGRNWRY